MCKRGGRQNWKLFINGRVSTIMYIKAMNYTNTYTTITDVELMSVVVGEEELENPHCPKKK